MNTIKQVAAAINRTTGRVRQLIRAGTIKAEREDSDDFGAGFRYRISDRELLRLQKLFDGTERLETTPRKPRKTRGK